MFDESLRNVSVAREDGRLGFDLRLLSVKIHHLFYVLAEFTEFRFLETEELLFFGILVLFWSAKLGTVRGSFALGRVNLALLGLDFILLCRDIFVTWGKLNPELLLILRPG